MAVSAHQELYREVCVLLFFRHGITPTANRLYQLVKKGSMNALAEALTRFWATLRDKSRVRIISCRRSEALGLVPFAKRLKPIISNSRGQRWPVIKEDQIEKGGAVSIEHWRFNANITWHYFSSAFYESVLSGEATNSFQHYHHLRACIYFSVCCFEAFLNGMMREKLASEGLPEEKIFDKLRRGKLSDKLKKWPSEIAGSTIDIPADLLETFENFQGVRNDVTHSKESDHSVYLKLDRLRPEQIINAVVRLMVTTLGAMGRPFPYWLLGWNYVGMNEGHGEHRRSLNEEMHAL